MAVWACRVWLRATEDLPAAPTEQHAQLRHPQRPSSSSSFPDPPAQPTAALHHRGRRPPTNLDLPAGPRRQPQLHRVEPAVAGIHHDGVGGAQGDLYQEVRRDADMWRAVASSRSQGGAEGQAQLQANFC